MEIILLERVEKLGNIGDIVRVRHGYARNFLLPQNKALRATKANRAQFELGKEELLKKSEALKSTAETSLNDLDGKFCTLLRQASDSGYLYGSVNARDIAGAISDLGTAVNRQQVLLDKSIKMLGIHPVRIKLHPEVLTTIQVVIARTDEEAESQRASFSNGTATAGEAEASHNKEDENMASKAEEFFEEGAGPLSESESEKDTDNVSEEKVLD